MEQGLQHYNYEVEDGQLASIEVYNEQDLIVAVELYSNMHEAKGKGHRVGKKSIHIQST